MAKKLPEVDPLSFIPIRYIDLRIPVPVTAFREGEAVLTAGKVVSSTVIEGPKGAGLQAVMSDAAGSTYRVRYIKSTKLHQAVFGKPGNRVFLFGAPKTDPEGWCLWHPEFPAEIGRIFPVYKCPSGISQLRMRRHVWKTSQALISTITDEVPPSILSARGLPPIAEAIRQIHCPDTAIPGPEFLDRLAYREITEIRQRILSHKRPAAPVMKGVNMAPFLKSLPFSPTRDQCKAIAEITADLASGTAMRRLLVGETGSGKTLVAQAAAYIAYQCNFRTLVLAPTIVLAGQLFDSFSMIFGREAVSLYTGKSKDNAAMIIIGTHALLNRRFSGVGLVIVDEQQRLGVGQRLELVGETHGLQQTATPIPRSVNLMFFGAVDISRLVEAPFRRSVRTKVVPVSEKDRILTHMRHVVSKGGKCLVIFPLAEKERGEHRAVEQMTGIWEKLFPDQVLYVHGKMEDKLDVVDMFRRSNKYRILLATSLIETGIDIPEAELLVVSSANMFGLSQLHQLRGRIGRRGNNATAYFIYKDPEARQKLKKLEEINDGFRLAEIDCGERGMGEIFGDRQSGHCFKLKDPALYAKAIEMVAEDLGCSGKRAAAITAGR